MQGPWILRNAAYLHVYLVFQDSGVLPVSAKELTLIEAFYQWWKILRVSNARAFIFPVHFAACALKTVLCTPKSGKHPARCAGWLCFSLKGRNKDGMKCP
jgi:hypothetical protein